MLIKYKDAKYNNKIEDLRNNGYTVNFVAFDYDDFITEEGNPVPFIELQLPNGGKSYNDYSAIVAWSDYFENEDNPDVPTDFNRTHSGMPVPSNFTVQDGDTPVYCYFVLEDTATEGIVRFSFAATSQGPFSNEDFKYFVQSFGGLMFIEGDEHNLEPDTSLVVPNLEAFFAQASGTADFQLDIANKSKLLSLGDNEAFPAYRYYKIIPSIPHGESSVIEFDGTSYHTENSSYQLLPLPIGTVLNLKGYTEEELKNTDVAEIYQTAEENISIFEDTVTNESFGCLHLQEPLIYPISRPLTLRSNIRIVGNGSTIMAYNMINDSGTYVAEKMSIIETTEDSSPVFNVTFENLTFRGRFENTDADVDDQCVYTQSEYPLLKNLFFENVVFDGFKFAVHTGSDYDIKPNQSFDWSFNNCEFINNETGFMLSWVQGITVTNCHIDNSIATDDLHHCMYIAQGSSYITVDNCLLENSIGGGIDFGDTSEESDAKRMHHCSFTNLQIRNCRIAVTIGNASEDIIVKNVFATNVGRALKLENCRRVTIDNFNATGNFYYEYIRKDAVGDTHWGNTDGEWGGISVWGYADVEITNSFFSTGGMMFSSSVSSLMADTSDSDDVSANLKVNNCIFVSTFSEYKVMSDGITYYQPGAFLGVNSNNSSKPYVYDVEFTNCQFYMNSENNESPMINLRGFEEHPSLYNFNNCLVAYRDGNGNELHDREIGDSINTVIKMPVSYFIAPSNGASAKIDNCVFYVNRVENEFENGDYGFVSSDYSQNCSINEKTKYNQLLTITKNTTGSESNNNEESQIPTV